MRYLVLPPSPIDMNNLGAYLVSGNWINLQCIVAEETYDLLQRKNRVKRVLFRASDDQQWTRSRWWSLMHYFQHKSFDTFKFDNSCHMLNEIKMYVHRARISVRTHFIVSPVRSIQIVWKWLRFAFALEKYKNKSRICSQPTWYFYHVLSCEISTMMYYVFCNLLIIQKVVTVRCRNPILRLMWFLVSCMKRINWLRTIFFSA